MVLDILDTSGHFRPVVDILDTWSTFEHSVLWGTYGQFWRRRSILNIWKLLLADGAPTVHYVHFVKYNDAVSFYDAVSDTIRRGGNRGIFTEEGVDTVAYFGGNHGFRV